MDVYFIEGVTLRGNSANRSGRRARRVSAGVSEDALATDSGSLRPGVGDDLSSGVCVDSSNRAEESEEVSYIKELTSVSEPTQIQLGLLYVKVHLIPLDAGRACAFYCCTALEPQSQMSFNEGFRIPVPANALGVCALQLSVCSLGPQAQEELLGTAQVSLADCESSADMVYHWLRVQMLSGTEATRPEQKTLSHRRHHDGQEDEQRPRVMDNVCTHLSRAATAERHAELELQRLEKREEPGEAASERSWQAESVDSGCSNSTAFTAPCSEGLCAEGVCMTTGGRCDQTASKLCTVKVECRAARVEKATMTEGLYPEPVRVRPKERGGRWGHASPFMRGSTIVRSQTFSPGARSQYVCRLYRSDSDSSTLPKKSPFVRNTLERRTLRYKQQSYRSSLAEQPTRTSLDLELDLQACRTRQRQLMEELSALRELKLRLEEPQAREATELPHWALRDERFRCLLREAQRQANQSKQEQRQEEAVERRMRKASKEVLQMRGQSQKEPLPVQTFREKMAFFTRPRFNIPPLPADDV
ncbi:hypothetical protein INR49_008641 [Caranx melampygus]|nr:hypothetical protein INR49_008641 [Caranx melampygus]